MGREAASTAQGGDGLRAGPAQAPGGPGRHGEGRHGRGGVVEDEWRERGLGLPPDRWDWARSSPPALALVLSWRVLSWRGGHRRAQERSVCLAEATLRPAPSSQLQTGTEVRTGPGRSPGSHR